MGSGAEISDSVMIDTAMAALANFGDIAPGRGGSSRGRRRVRRGASRGRGSGCAAPADLSASAELREHLARVLVRRGLEEAGVD